jgi:hypothetical protein
MSLTAAIWAALAVVCALLSFRRPVWAVALYMLTFFAAPHLWWWGRDLPSLRYAFWAGHLLLLAVVVYRAQSVEDDRRHFSIVHAAAVAVTVNAAFVHVLLAADPRTSWGDYVELLKFTLLFFLIWAAIQNRRDFRTALIAVALGVAYLGYEVTINGRGDFNGARLEGIGAPGAETANDLACLVLTTLPLIGCLFVGGNKRERLVMVASAPLALNLLLLCNSRGAFLGLIGAGLSFFVIARGATRKKAVRALLLASVALYFLLGDPEILDRFVTTFVGSEERDNAAASRIDFWKAGILMVWDHPFGAGGSAFKFVYGPSYLAQVTGLPESRSLHNAYITEATSWGAQGLALKLVFLLGAMVAAYRTTARCRQEGRTDDALVGMCVIAAAVGFLIHSFFGAFFNNEWSYWLIAFLVRYREVYRVVEQPAPQVQLPATMQVARERLVLDSA